MRNGVDEGRVGVDVIAALALYAVEASGLGLAMALHRMGDRSLPAFLASRAGILCGVALAMLVVSSILIIHRYHSSRVSGWVPFRLAVTMNLVTVIVLLTLAELGFRVLSLQTPQGLVFLDTPLLPREWKEEVARNQQILRKASLEGSYLVHDDLMGWTVGPNRRSADGLYFSSVEGIRSPRAGTAFAGVPATYRIGLVGDSYTFCLDVTYAESWGAQLERELGPGFQVLNFGVSGYGLDQAYLRYSRDVRPWHPDVVVFGVFPHDAERTMIVYPFISFPDWEYPFSKPRFVRTPEQLVMLNVPALSPDGIFAKSSIKKLPYLDYDKGYHEGDWQWRYYHYSHIVRLLVSRYPVWRVPRGPVSDEEMTSVNSELLRAFLRLARAAGSRPIVVYLPPRRDLDRSASGPKRGTSLAQSALASAGIEYIDLTPTLMEISGPDRFVGGDGHYSRQTNAAIAKRLREVILGQPAGGKGRQPTARSTRGDL